MDELVDDPKLLVRIWPITMTVVRAEYADIMRAYRDILPILAVYAKENQENDDAPR